MKVAVIEVQRISQNIGRVLLKFKESGIFKIVYLFVVEILKGYKTYKKILLKYQDDSNHKIFYMDYSGSGDTYLSCSYLSSIGEISGNDIFIAPSYLAAKIAGYYNFKNIEMIEGSCAFSVRKMERFYQSNILWKSLLYESDPLIYSGIMRHIQGYKGFDFMTLLKIGYEVNLGVEYTEKTWKQNLILFNGRNSIFEKLKFPKGNTVLIAPYAGMNSLFGISFEFYCSITSKLKKLGFVVCTNSNGTCEDRPIPGTLPIFLPHEQMIRFCEDAGYFLGTRSGLCDIVSSAKLKKKIIIYPDQKISQGVGKWIDFFSLNKMGLCDDAIEYNYNKNSEQALVNEIIETFIGCKL